MRFSLQREVFLKPLAQVVNVVERRQTLPVLANLLVQVREGQLSLTGTDLEVEMVALDLDQQVGEDRQGLSPFDHVDDLRERFQEDFALQAEAHADPLLMPKL